MNNRIVIDLSKVQHASLHYVNQEGLAYPRLPKRPSVRGMYIDDKQIAAYHEQYPGETLRERATRMNLFDRWTPVVTFTLASNHCVRYTGKKATVMWKEWNARIFKKKGKK